MDKKKYLIAGGSSGIGLSLVKKLVEKGNEVIAISRTEGGLAGLPGVSFHAADLTKDEVDASWIPESLDGVAYCPGSIVLKPFRSLKIDQFQEDFEVNVLGAVKVLKAAFPALKKNGNSSVVLFSTVAVEKGMPFHASIAAAKGAVAGLARSLAAEWAPSIRVNAVAPSLTDTPLAERLLATPERREASAERHPLKRIGTADDIASAALFLLESSGSWISGQVMAVDGGMSRLGS